MGDRCRDTCVGRKTWQAGAGIRRNRETPQPRRQIMEEIKRNMPGTSYKICMRSVCSRTVQPVLFMFSDMVTPRPEERETKHDYTSPKTFTSLHLSMFFRDAAQQETFRSLRLLHRGWYDMPCYRAESVIQNESLLPRTS